MRKVKSFEATSLKVLEKAINKWVENKEDRLYTKIIDIKLIHGQFGVEALVIYE